MNGRRFSHGVVLLGLCSMLVACGQAEVVATSPTIPSSSITASPTAAPASVEPSESPSASPSASATPATALIESAWTVPFSMTAPSDWTTRLPDYLGTTTPDTMWFGTVERQIALSRSGPETVDDWVESVTTAEQLTATEPIPVEIGGATGFQVDLEVSDAASERACPNNGRCYTLFQDDSGYWPVVEGRTTRAWFVDVDGETLVIVTDAREASFDAWMVVVEAALATLEWAG